jgi:hypothetical protein
MSVYDRVSDQDLEMLLLDLITDYTEQDRIRAHISICHLCSAKADWTERYVQQIGDQLRTLHGSEVD